MFDQINGLPVHALVLHAAVIFVPLLALGAIVYAVMGRWRSKIGWAVAGVAVIAPLSALVAMLSGGKLLDRLVANGLQGQGKVILDDHMAFGSLTFYISLVLGIVTLVMVALTLRKGSSLSKGVEIGLSVVMVVLAVAAGYYVFRTGDSGAMAVWGQY